MDTARASKLAAVLAALMLIAVMTALLAARGSLGFADWPAASKAPMPEETVVIVDGDPALVPPLDRTRSGAGAAPVPAPAAEPAPATALAGVEAEPEPPAEPVELALDAEPRPERAEPERAQGEGPEEVEPPARPAPAPDAFATPASEWQGSARGDLELARPAEDAGSFPQAPNRVAPEPEGG